MSEEFRSYIKSRAACATHHIRRAKLPGHLQSIELSASGNLCIIVLTDYLRKYVFAKAVPKNKAVLVAEFLVETSFTFDVPGHVITDQCTHFRNELIDNLTPLLGCKHTCVTPYHSQSNDQCERWNLTMRP